MTGLPTGRSGERGVALLLSLLLLTSLTLLGLAAASDASLQNRMVGNLEKNLTATRHAESAGRWAEAWLLGLDGDQRPNPCSDRCGPGQVIRQSGTYPALPERESEDWWRFSGFVAGTGSWRRCGSNPPHSRKRRFPTLRTTASLPGVPAPRSTA
jgi:hypothetical protein